MLAPAFVVHGVVRHYWGEADQVCMRLDKSEELSDWLTEVYEQTPGITLVPSWPAPEFLSQAQRLRKSALERLLPSALLVTQRKSASVSVGGILANGFSLPTVLCFFSQARTILPWALDFKRGGGLLVRHLEPLRKNIDLSLEAGISKVLVNVGGPRGQLLSMQHHLSRYQRFNHPEFNVRWQHCSFDERIDWLLRGYLRLELEWIKGWVAAQDKLDVKFSTYEQFVDNRDDFVEQMIADYGGGARYFSRSAALEITPGVDYHVTKGTTDPWKTELSQAQIRRINDAIPSDWWELFGWNP